MNKAEEIKLIINKIITILVECDKEDFISELQYFLIYIDQNYEDCLYKMRTIYGGMGSFNDVILYKNGEILIKENREFSLLRNDLFEICFLRKSI